MNPEHVEIVKKGREAYIQWRMDYPHDRFDLDGANIDDLDLHDLDLKNSNFQNAHFKNANFSESNLDSVHLDDCILNGADFSGCKLNNTKFSSSDLSSAILFGADIRGAYFDEANLESADFRSVNANVSTSFKTINNTDKCKIDRFTLEALREYGGLSVADRMKMKIIDDAAKLRMKFCGIWRWLHVLALLTFIAPYLFFVIVRLSENHYLGIQDSGMPLWEALWRYIQTGHGNWQQEPLKTNSWALGTFYVFLGYNMLRIILLFKANALEMKDSISKLPVNFSLEFKGFKWPYRWSILYYSMYGLLIVYAIAVVFNGYYFFQSPIRFSLV